MITRRRTLQSVLVSLPAITLSITHSQASSNAAFQHGVASGDPGPDSVVLWTRVTTVHLQASVMWEVATKSDFRSTLTSGSINTSAERDYTVKALISGLPSGTPLFYRFRYEGAISQIGRTRTLPTGSLDRLGIALVSCSNHAFGYFNAYDAIARDTAIDFVLHTGDYLYEHGADEWGSESANRLQRQHQPAHEIITLTDYRLRHAQYKRDFAAQAMHAAHPFIALWDDHESANNPWTAGAQNHQPATEGDWATRRDAAIRAYYEWMPVRDPAPGADPKAFSRVYRFGTLATLITLETRHTARSQQVDYADYQSIIRDSGSRNLFMSEVVGAPRRSMLAPAMEQVVTKALSSSIAAGEPWRLIGNAVPMARMLLPDLEAAGALPSSMILDAATELRWKGRWQLPFYTDTWDGYPWARQRFYQQCREAGAQDLLVLTGDSHSFWANRLASDDGQPMGIEIGTAGVTSPGDFIDSGFDKSTAARLDQALADLLDEVLWTDNLHQGYVRVVLHPRQAVADFIAVSTIETTAYTSAVLKTFRIGRRGESIDYLG
jgi:alkaline phosphatase D